MTSIQQRANAIRNALLALGAALGLLTGACTTSGPRTQADAIESYLEAERPEDAARAAENAIRRDPENPELRKLAARAHGDTGNAERAIDHLEVALQLSPSDPAISIELGRLEQERENVPDAYVAYRRATQLAPDDIRGWSGLALTAEALGFEQEAVDAYAHWAELEREQGLDP